MKGTFGTAELDVWDIESARHLPSRSDEWSDGRER